MVKKHLIALLALGAGIAGAGSAFAEQRQPRPDPLGDATVSRADVETKVSAQFAQLDTDRDGTLSSDEMQAMFAGRGGGVNPMALGMMMRADTDGDGKLGRSEFTAAALGRFDMADADHDGQLTKAERDAMRSAMRQRWHERRSGGDAMGGGTMPPPPPDDDGD